MDDQLDPFQKCNPISFSKDKGEPDWLLVHILEPVINTNRLDMITYEQVRHDHILAIRK